MQKDSKSQVPHCRDRVAGFQDEAEEAAELPRLPVVPEQRVQVSGDDAGCDSDVTKTSISPFSVFCFSRSLVVPTDKRHVLHFGKVSSVAQERFCLAALPSDDGKNIVLGAAHKTSLGSFGQVYDVSKCVQQASIGVMKRILEQSSSC